MTEDERLKQRLEALKRLSEPLHSGLNWQDYLFVVIPAVVVAGLIIFYCPCN